ncbi:hypothetical protein QBC38DRAFT_492174 [Podospora fimiseda]|uniref:Uncharacterized protein n=1 Tax=Podospora fimiseda TaxID=252190 RepID=A0AAN6YLD0_9PEZI|nr:hypothetical protein QBC38DRAFT_492174 [Podospora fimiseda]
MSRPDFGDSSRGSFSFYGLGVLLCWYLGFLSLVIPAFFIEVFDYSEEEKKKKKLFVKDIIKGSRQYKLVKGFVMGYAFLAGCHLLFQTTVMARLG